MKVQFALSKSREIMMPALIIIKSLCLQNLNQKISVEKIFCG